MGTLGIKVSYETAKEAANHMIQHIREVCCDYNIDNAIVAGSVRRHKTTDIGDIDIILVTTDGQIHPQFSMYLQSSLGFRIDAGGSKLVRSISPAGIQFDFYSCSESEIGPMLAYLTGPDTWNIGMRSTARNLGYKLNQKALIRLSDQSQIQIVSEVDLFHVLGCKYIEPENRVDWYHSYRSNRL